ncbi:hypothetical protein LP420_07685 [Massilia sp. B-10]|nr:hypothetical protein LP420_07685 [Massilia sp. B-10]
MVRVATTGGDHGKNNPIEHAGRAGRRSLLVSCASLSEDPDQEVMVRAVQDNREIGNVGCVLTNNAGRWFVTAPATSPCARALKQSVRRLQKGNASAGQERFASRPNNTATIGNAITTAAWATCTTSAPAPVLNTRKR